MTTQIPHFINGKRTAGQSTRTADVFNPSTGEVQAKVQMAGKADVDAAVASAAEAQKDWAAWNPQRRARVMMRFIELVNDHNDELAELLSLEHGKTVADARGDIQRGIEVIEFCIGNSAPAQGRIQRGRGPGHRRLLVAPAAGRGRGHHPVQLSGDDPPVEGRTGPGVRKRVRAQAQ